MVPVRADVSEESIASIIRVKRICEQGQMLAVTGNCNHCAKIQLLVIANADSFNSDDGGDKFLRNAGH
jgi:hypothetical protein